MEGLVLNVGSGDDMRVFGRRTIRVDRFAPAVTVKADLATALPFRAGAFDGAVCSEVLEHVTDPTLVLVEMGRVLKPGAPALVTMPFVFHHHPDPDDFRRYSPQGLRQALETAGFRVELVAALGGKLTALALLCEAIHPVAKVAVRTILAPLAPLWGRAAMRHGRWSDYAANVVAIGRAR